MIWLYYALLLTMVAAGFALVIFTLPGLWLMTLAAAGYALLTEHRHLIGAGVLITLFVLSLAAELIEIGLTGAAAKKAGGGKRAAIGGIVGGLIGGIFLTVLFPVPVLGTIFGICLGSFLGAAGLELLGGKKTDHSLRVGLGAAKGRFLGIVSKLAMGVAMAGVIAWTGFP